MPHSSVRLEVYGRGWSDYREQMAVFDKSNELILYPEGFIVGKVVDEKSGSPITEFNVRLGFTGQPMQKGERQASYSAHLSSRGQNCQSPEGHFTISELISRSRVKVTITAEGYPRKTFESVPVEPRNSDLWPMKFELEKD